MIEYMKIKDKKAFAIVKKINGKINTNDIWLATDIKHLKILKDEKVVEVIITVIKK